MVERVTSIVVPTLNEALHIEKTVAALKALEGEKEIVVVDGGSTDETLLIAERAGARVLTARRGRGVQLHTGALLASGDIFWFVHADTLPPPHALREIERALANPTVAGGNFALIFDGTSRAARQLTTIYPALRRLNLCYGDSGIFVRRETYHQVGGFRPLPLFEDLDLLKRLRQRGSFVHLSCPIVTSSRRFESRNFATMWAHWTALQVLYWAGVSPDLLARWYRAAR